MPFLKNTRPYQQVPIQISAHIVDKNTGKIVNHYGFIFLPAENFKIENFEVKNLPKDLILEKNILVFGNYNDLIKIFINKLKGIIGGLNNGSFIVWNKGFENSVNKICALLNPDLQKDLFIINKNVFDLMEFYRNYTHFHIKSWGSYSIKYVLPAINNEINYNKLNIKNGDQAQKILEKILKGILLERKDYKIFGNELNDLFIYCGQDSFAMYLIYNYIKNHLGI